MALWHWDGGMALTDVSIIDHPVGEEEGEGGLYWDEKYELCLCSEPWPGLAYQQMF